MTALEPPFVLLDDARAGADPARLYRRPVAVIEAAAPGEVRGVLDAVRAGTARGLYAAGFLSYEAGEAFEPAAGTLGAPTTPLAWFALFEHVEEVADVPALLPDPAGAWIGPLADLPARGDYDAGLARVLELIAAGDLYQANYTFRATVRLHGGPLAAYARLRDRAAAGWGGIVATGRDTLLSFSPELFFTLDHGRLTCRPMKGTARRGDTAEGDARAAATLRGDAKQRAENLMIVDLMRNDLSRIAVPGSVAVPELFAVETYPTVHQLVSTVTADLAGGRDAVDVLAAAFPCGSITGAPKVRAMQALAGIETGAPRGAYTGAIGRIDPDGGAAFNVAIRTLAMPAGESRATVGLGGGIVADSRADDEWDEALAKAAFLDAGPGFDLVETMAFDPEEGIALLERHLARLKESAATFGFAFDRHHVRNELQAATFRLREAKRVRLLVARSGAIAIEVAALPPAPTVPVAVGIVPLPVPPSDFRLRHKTTARGFYDAARARAGTFEVVFDDRAGRITEGSFTSVFVERDGMLLTPSGDALLPGVLRAELLASGRAREAELFAEDLADGFFVGNALRGLIPAVAVAARPRL